MDPLLVLLNRYRAATPPMAPSVIAQVADVMSQRDNARNELADLRRQIGELLDVAPDSDLVAALKARLARDAAGARALESVRASLQVLTDSLDGPPEGKLDGVDQFIRRIGQVEATLSATL